MFEERLTIAVKGISFDMILVEGDRFCIGNREVELDDFYIAEIPVTQELYMAVMGPAHTGSYSLMPNNFDYLHPKRLSYLCAFESSEDHQKRLDLEREEEDRERNRIRTLSASLPVNNISWLEAIAFVDELNKLSEHNFALPSFEQWYFAAVGGVKTRGYDFAGADDANEIGHFHKLSTQKFSPGLYIMTNNESKQKIRKEATTWYSKPKQYKYNELGVYDMSGLVNEWLDEAGMFIGGSFFSNPDEVSREHLFGYTRFSGSYKSMINPVFVTNKFSNKTSYKNLFGIRLVLVKERKKYYIPEMPNHSIPQSEKERWFCEVIEKNEGLGLLRSFVAYKYVRQATIRCQEEHVAYSSIRQSIQNIFIYPRNLPLFKGSCFENYSSRRKFISHCKEEFINLLTLLSDSGFNILIKDNLDIGLTDTGIFSNLKINLDDRNFRLKSHKEFAKVLRDNVFVTNNPEIIRIDKLLSSFGQETKYDQLELASNTVLITINDTITLQDSVALDEEWLHTVDTSKVSKSEPLRLTLNCFCEFYDSDYDLVKFMRNHVKSGLSRIHKENFDNSERINWLFCKRNQGGFFECNFPLSSGKFLILDDKFFILPKLVFDEWSHSLKLIKS